jgi:hypothetical protein
MAKVVIMIPQQAENIPGQVDFSDFGGLLLDSNKGFSWTCVQTTDEEVAQLIKTSHSVYPVPRI